MWLFTHTVTSTSIKLNVDTLISYSSSLYKPTQRTVAISQLRFLNKIYGIIFTLYENVLDVINITLCIKTQSNATGADLYNLITYISIFKYPAYQFWFTHYYSNKQLLSMIIFHQQVSSWWYENYEILVALIQITFILNRNRTWNLLQRYATHVQNSLLIEW